MAKITFLSHASILIESNGSSIIIDPWLIGSCYWRSWWNYPPVKQELLEGLNVDAVYLTHVHWDHWHGPSLKKYISKDTLIVTHDEPNKRSFNDLNNMGFNNIKLLKHSEHFRVGDINLTPYQFGLFLNDSALVIETPDLKLLNANDCKIAGSSLRNIINKHGKFDFALRSHSSANDRVCYEIENVESNNLEKDHYNRAFYLFMNAVKPRYAVPFASNHCHLHKDVYSMNSIINDPFKLSDYLSQNSSLIDSELKILLSGDSWDSIKGFNINESNEDYFRNKELHLESYKNTVNEKLESFYKQENRLKPNKRIVQMFSDQINRIPKILRKKFKDYSYKLILFNDNKEWTFKVTPHNGEIIDCDNNFNTGSEVRIPIKVFIDAVSMNMFHHSTISKRIKYKFNNSENFVTYKKFQNLLEYVELEVFPLRFRYFYNLIIGYSRRWREVLVYFKTIFLISKGMKMYEIEEEILKNS